MAAAWRRIRAGFVLVRAELEKRIENVTTFLPQADETRLTFDGARP